MGRIMSFDQDGRMAHDFDKSEHDFLRRYGRTPEEVIAENAKLRELADKLSILADCECEGCLHVDNCPLMAYGDECPVSLEVKLLKRELGIEVPDGEV